MKSSLRRDKTAEIEIFSSGNEVYDGIKTAENEIFSSGNEVYDGIKLPKLKFSEVSGNEVYADGIKLPKLKFSRQEMKSTTG